MISLMKTLLIIFALLLLSCAHNGYNADYCIPPTYQNAQRAAGLFPMIVSLIDISKHGHLQGHKPIHEKVIRQRMHDLNLEYQACLNRKHRQDIHETDRRVENLLRETYKEIDNMHKKSWKQEKPYKL